MYLSDEESEAEELRLPRATQKSPVDLEITLGFLPLSWATPPLAQAQMAAVTMCAVRVTQCPHLSAWDVPTIKTS